MTLPTCLQWVERQRGQWRQHDATLARAWCAEPAVPPVRVPEPRSAVPGPGAVIVLPDARPGITR